MKVLRLIYISHQGFNPCFSGSCSRIFVCYACTWFILWFQSLFQWILLTNRPDLFLWQTLSYVSILVLVDLAHECEEHLIPKSQCRSFNPCFSGSCSRIRENNSRLLFIHSVSILVLVDLAHESYFRMHFKEFLCRFQSLFQWILLTNPIIQSVRKSENKVSILVLVDLAHE